MNRLSLLCGCLLLGGCAGAALPNISRESLEGIGRMAGAAMVAKTLPIGPEKEREIGRGIAAIVAGRYGVVREEELNRYVNLVGQAVAQQSPRSGEVEFRFAVLDTADVNAFAAPGGYIFVTRGALALMETEADLAGVLAHEVAHVDKKHVLSDIQNADAARAAADEARISGPLLDRLSELGASLLFSSVERKDELEADSLGLLYAAATGYRADGLPRFVGRLAAAEQKPTARMQEWMATHPAAADRLAALDRQMQALGPAGRRGVPVAERFQKHVRSALRRPE